MFLGKELGTHMSNPILSQRAWLRKKKKKSNCFRKDIKSSMFKEEFRSRLMDYGLFPASLFLRLALIPAGFAVRRDLTSVGSCANFKVTTQLINYMYLQIIKMK